MNSWLAFGIGLIIGGGAAYFIAKKETESKLWNAYYEEHKEQKVAGSGKKEAAKTATKREEEAKEALDRYNPDIKNSELTAERLDTSKIASKKANLDMKYEENQHYITVEEFANDETSSLAVVNWWPAAGVATDEMDEEEVADVDKLIGEHLLRQAAEVGSELCYIKNEKLRTIYEVHVCQGLPHFLDD